MTKADFSAMYDKAKNIEQEAWSLGADASKVTAIIEKAEAEIDRLHDECNQRAKEQETTENTLREVLNIEDDEIGGLDGVMTLAELAAMHIEFLRGEVVRMSNFALAGDSNYKYGVGMIVGSSFVAACGILAWLVL